MAAKMAPHDANAGLIIREREPVNLEYPFDQLDEFLTPNDLFYTRSHFKAPALSRDTFELSISGAVQKPFSIRYKDLLTMPSVTRPATLECAGNGRIFLVPQVKGAQWQLGAVSTAQWTGVPLATLLERAGLDPDACEVVFEAADKGKPNEEPVPPGDTQYARSLSLAKAADTVIAWAMNGEELSADHGFPLRAIVPGHYGMASVKWLTAIRVVDKPFQGYWQTSDYGYWEYQDGNPVRLALGAMAIKSAIARPRTREVLHAGQSYVVAGASWGGDIVTATELSVDDGTSWQPVHFLDEPQQFAWRRWEFTWTVPEEKGTYMLRSRATDNAGNTQPKEHDTRFGTYVIHHTFPIEVVVR